MCDKNKRLFFINMSFSYAFSGKSALKKPKCDLKSDPLLTWQIPEDEVWRRANL